MKSNFSFFQFIFVSFVFTSLGLTHAQILDTVTTKTFLAFRYGYTPNNMIPLKNNDCYISGSAGELYASAFRYTAGYFTFNCDSIWMKIYPTNNVITSSDAGPLCTSSDTTLMGNIILAGWKSYPVLRSDIWLLEINKSGDTVRSVIIGDSIHENIANSIQYLPNDGYIIGGSCNDTGYNTRQCYIIRTDISAKPVWKKRLVIGKSSEIHKIVLDQNKNDGFIFVGQTTTLSGSNWIYSGLIGKVDLLGNLLWSKTVVNGQTFIHDITSVPSSGYMAVGSMANQTCVTRFKENGDTLWTKLFSGYCNIPTIKKYSDSSWLVLTYNADGQNSNLSLITGLGNIIWQRIIPHRASALGVFPDGSVKIAGNYSTYLAQPEIGFLQKYALNYPPYFTNTKNIVYDTCTEDSLYQFTFLALDSFPHDFVKYTISGATISTMDIDSLTGIFTWRPTTDLDSGNHILTIECHDKLNQIDSIQFNLFVRAVNDPPEITTITPEIFKVDSLYLIPLTATDEEGNFITWTIPQKPSSMVIDSNRLKWLPRETGIDTIVLIASDGNAMDSLVSIIRVEGNSQTKILPTSSIPSSLKVSCISARWSTNLIIGLPLEIKTSSIKIYSISGRMVENHTVLGSGWHTIPLSKYSKGVLLARISAGGKTIERRIVSY